MKLTHLPIEGGPEARIRPRTPGPHHHRPKETIMATKHNNTLSIQDAMAIAFMAAPLVLSLLLSLLGKEVAL